MERICIMNPFHNLSSPLQENVITTRNRKDYNDGINSEIIIVRAAHVKINCYYFTRLTLAYFPS